MKMPQDLIALLVKVSSPLGAEISNALTLQGEAAEFEFFSPTMLDVLVPSDCDEVDLPNGPIPVNAIVRVGNEDVGEVLVWIRHRMLIGLEQPWWTDEPPTRWPKPEEIRFD